MKKILSTIIALPLLFNVAFADIIDPGPYPGDFPRPVPAPSPEPVDDGEVVVIKTLFYILTIVVISAIIYMNYKKSKIKEI